MFNYNPYYQVPINQARYQPQVDNQYQQFNTQIQQPQYRQQILGLQGKSVDSVDVVRAMDIPLDGSISYFPLTDGTAIISKQLQMDGTSKTIIYKPIENESDNIKENPISKELSDEMKNLTKSNSILKNNIEDMKNQINDLSNDLDKILKEMQTIKGGKK